jgi:hypothetical protein
MRWEGHFARMGRVGVYTGFWWGNLKERSHLEDQGVDGSIILRCFIRKWDVEVWSASICPRIGTGGRYL